MTGPLDGAASDVLGAAEPLDDFERAVVEAVAALAAPGDPTAAAALREHAGGATVVRRDRDAAGVTTYVCVPAGATRLDPGERTLRARAELAGLAAPAAVEVAVHNGWLDAVTVVLSGGAWPARATLGAVTLPEMPA